MTEVVCTRRGTHVPAAVMFTAPPPPPGGAFAAGHLRNGPLPWASRVDVRCPACGWDEQLGVERWAALCGALAAGLPVLDVSYM